MFVVILTYQKPIEMIDEYLSQRRAHLEEGYQKNYLIASGPQNPRTGGVLVSQLKDKALLETFIHEDPFYVHQLADYQIIEFNPVKYHPEFIQFIQQH